MFYVCRVGTDLAEMKQFCGTGDCGLDHSAMTTMFLDGVEQTSQTPVPTSDPLNVMGQMGGVVISLMIVIGVIGNVLVLTAIVQCPQLRRSYNAFIASLSVTDLIFNVAVMPFYVDTYIHRQWRFSDAICRWHTYFGTIVIVSSSLHIALIAISRYQVIVHPRFYARWLSSGVAVVSQIVFAWVAAVALVLPGIVGVLPTAIGYSDQLSRCSYDRVTSHCALSVVFGAGFIVPCVVMGYCYGMIWHRTLEVRLRVDGFNSLKLQQIRQQDGAANCPPSSVVISPNSCVNAQETERMKPLLDSGNDQQLATEDDKIVDVYRSTSEQSSDKNGRTDCMMESPQGTAADCRVRLLPVVDDESIDVVVDHRSVELSDDIAPNDASTAVQSSSATIERANCSCCNDSNDDKDVDDNEQENADERRRQINSSEHNQLKTSSFSACSSGKTDNSSSGPSMDTRSTVHTVVRDKGVFDNHVTNGNNDQSAATELQHHLPAETQTLKHESIRVVITPATNPNSTVIDLQESPTEVEASDVADKTRGIEEHLLHLTKSDDTHQSVGHSELSTTQHSFRISSFHRRLVSREVGERSPASSLPAYQRHRSHSLHMILAVFFAFVLTYLPYTVTNLADEQARLDRSVYMLTSLAFWAGSCVNPLIYGIMNVQFRRAYVSIVVNCWRHSVARCRNV